MVSKRADRTRTPPAKRSAGTQAPRWLIIVESARPDVIETLRQGFEHDSGVQVIFDRRRVDRRRGAAETDPERRQEQRRRPPPATEVAFGKNAGFFLIVRR